MIPTAAEVRAPLYKGSVVAIEDTSVAETRSLQPIASM